MNVFFFLFLSATSLNHISYVAPRDYIAYCNEYISPRGRVSAAHLQRQGRAKSTPFKQIDKIRLCTAIWHQYVCQYMYYSYFTSQRISKNVFDCVLLPIYIRIYTRSIILFIKKHYLQFDTHELLPLNIPLDIYAGVARSCVWARTHTVALTAPLLNLVSICACVDCMDVIATNLLPLPACAFDTHSVIDSKAIMQCEFKKEKLSHVYVPTQIPNTSVASWKILMLDRSLAILFFFLFLL